ncbi:hypothetical protein GUJ93_ZPchr0003g16837 [Zizania palustris]|uniref:Uncharacterized protein n=1 Tax=Zizania palustris TaxID=103762 RepID=A0A8J5SJI5_ZIZPA|nr:hypothetical protein GUJ93_ZPchr0003g16837 [Zizania palustris]
MNLQQLDAVACSRRSSREVCARHSIGASEVSVHHFAAEALSGGVDVAGVTRWALGLRQQHSPSAMVWEPSRPHTQ